MYLPTHPTSGEQPSGVGIHGISARKVYPLLLLLTTVVGFYPTFSPLPFDVNIKPAVIFCGTFSSRKSREPAVNRYVALRCPDFPTLQLTSSNNETVFKIDSKACSKTKVITNNCLDLAVPEISFYLKKISVAPYPKDGWYWLTNDFTSFFKRRMSCISSLSFPLPTPWIMINCD
jgi:hypothetical protein